MKSTKLHIKERMSEVYKRKFNAEDVEMSAEILEIKPWNSNRLTKITASINDRHPKSNIFSLSNRSSHNKIKQKSQRSFTLTSSHKIKPGTAPHHATNRASSQRLYESGKNILSEELKKLGSLTTEEVLDDAFEENLQNINFYPQFKASVQQKKSLLFIKPYVKCGLMHQKDQNIESLNEIEKFKSELYKGIHESEKIYTQLELDENQNPTLLQEYPKTNRSVIQYMTEYKGDKSVGEKNFCKSSTSQCGHSAARNKQVPLAVLREKLKNRYRDSSYANKIGKVKTGEEKGK